LIFVSVCTKVRVRMCDVFLGGVFWVALFERERERDIYTTTKIHSLNDGKGAKMKKRLFLLPSRLQRREKSNHQKSHKKEEDFFFAPFYYSFILLFPASFLFFFVGLVIKPHV